MWARGGTTAPVSTALKCGTKQGIETIYKWRENAQDRVTGFFRRGIGQMTVLRMKCPLTPIRRGGAAQSIASERITPETALDLERLLITISPEIISRFHAGPAKWAVVSPIASYSSSHVMIANIDEKRYVPGAEFLSAPEGDEVFQVSIQALDFLSRKSAADHVSVGVNWSEFSWGLGLEEQSGFASMPTKVHFHVWTWPAPPDVGRLSVYNDAKTEWVREEDLPPHLYRLIIKNDYGVLLGDLLAASAREALVQTGAAGLAVASELVNPTTWSCDARGAYATLKRSLLSLLKDDPRIFSRVIQPIARAASDLLIRLTEIFTDMNCSRLREILKGIEAGPLSATEIAALRAVPNVRPEDEIRSALDAQGLPAGLVQAILPAVRERCLESRASDPSRMWRKGFGYALVLSGPVEGQACELRLMPGVYLGPGGVVEAQRVVLSRVPIPAPHNELLRRSRMMLQLGCSIAA
jgi:hypothetical protein